MSTELSDEQLKELETLYQKATPEEWTAFWSDQFGWCLKSLKSGHLGEKEYGLAAGLHNTFPALLSTIQSLRSRLDEANKPFVDADSQIQIMQNDNTFSYKVASVLALGFNTWREAYRAGEDYLNQIEAVKETDSLRTELAASQKLVERLTEKLDDILEALPEDSPSHRADITGQTMAEDVSDLVKANDGFQKLCGELRTELAAAKEEAKQSYQKGVDSTYATNQQLLRDAHFARSEASADLSVLKATKLSTQPPTKGEESHE